MSFRMFSRCCAAPTLGGWSDYAMVLRYAHLAPDHLAGFAGNAKPYQRAA
jgi:hypothetical protein